VVCTSGTIALKPNFLILGFIIFTTGGSYPLKVAGKSPFSRQKILTKLLYWPVATASHAQWLLKVRTKVLAFSFSSPATNTCFVR